MADKLVRGNRIRCKNGTRQILRDRRVVHYRRIRSLDVHPADGAVDSFNHIQEGIAMEQAQILKNRGWE